MQQHKSGITLFSPAQYHLFATTDSLAAYSKVRQLLLKLFRPLQRGDNDHAIIRHNPLNKTHNRHAEELLPHCGVIQNSHQFQFRLLHGEIGNFSNFIHPAEHHLRHSFFFEGLKQRQVILPCNGIEIGEVAQVLVGEPAFLGDTRGGEEVGVAVAGKVLNSHIPLGHQVLQVGIHQPDGDTGPAGKLPLGEGFLAGNLGEEEEGAVGIDGLVAVIVHGMNNTGNDTKWQGECSLYEQLKVKGEK